MLQENGPISISQMETVAGDEYRLYLQVLREMIDNNAVINDKDKIRLP